VKTLVLVLLASASLSAAAARPHRAVTPGLTRPLTRAQVCATRWGRDRRHVTTGMKRRVAAAYGVPWSQHAQYEFDHLVPRELAGADDERNLWPQPWASAHRKDRLENRLRVLVCRGELPLRTAQREIATDWVAAYHRYVVAQ
jgi:hypothetical protein